MFEECLLQILAFMNFLPETLLAPNMALTRTQWLAKILVSVDKIYKSKQFGPIKKMQWESHTIGLVCDCSDN